METQQNTTKRLHPLAWAAGIAVILFSVVGVGAMMGWIPNSMSSAGDQSAMEAKTASAAATANESGGSAAKKSPQPSGDNRSHRTQTSSASTESSTVPVVPVAPVAQASARCAECGVIQSVREIAAKGSGSGLGAVGGAVVGGVLGNQVGGGRGQDAMTVVGAVGGALAGNEIEKRVKTTKTYAVTVRFEDASTREINTGNTSTWRVGDKVKVVNGAIQSNT